MSFIFFLFFLNSIQVILRKIRVQKWGFNAFIPRDFFFHDHVKKPKLVLSNLDKENSMVLDDKQKKVHCSRRTSSKCSLINNLASCYMVTLTTKSSDNILF